jgi:cobalt-zinc-cadmium efflux system outer membrane protein
MDARASLSRMSRVITGAFVSMARVLGFGLALLGVAVGAGAEEPITRLSLTEAIGLAARENPTVRAKEFEYRAVGAGEITAGLRPNPSFTFSGEQFTSGGSSGAAIVQYTVSVGQPIELGNKRARRIDSAKAATRVTGYELADVQRQVLYQVKKSFTDALAAREALSLAQQNLDVLDEAERIQRVRAEKGDISDLELLRIQVQRFAFQRDAADAAQALRAAKIALRAVMGPARLAPEFEVVGDLAFREVEQSPAALYRRALDNRPDLRAAEATRARAGADIRLARANAWWDVTPQIEYQRIGPDNTIGFGFSVPLRIFDRNQGEIARTQAEAQRSAAAQEALATQMLAEVDTAFTAMQTERGKLVLLRDNYLPKARQVRDTVDYAYRRGGLSLLDFLDAQRSYRDTSVEYVRALGNYWTAYYQLEAAVGGTLGD